MRRVTAAMVGVALAVSSGAVAQDWAKANLAKSSRHGEYVTINEPGGRKLQAWVVYPEVKDKAPVVVMIHEIFGLSDWAREMADEIAGAGYIVVEPDLLSEFGPAKVMTQIQAPGKDGTVPVAYGCDPMDCVPGQTPTRSWRADAALEQYKLAAMAAQQTSQPALVLTGYEPQQGQSPQQYHSDHPIMSDAQAQEGGLPYVPARPGGTSAFPDQGSVTRAVSALPDAQVMADLDAAADYGKRLPSANGKLFVAGFCWGGGKSFLFATHRHDLSAAFVFYGPPPATDLLKNITAPVYGFYAQNDARITATVPKTQDAMKGFGKTYETVVYDGAGHGFMRAGEAPDASAANASARQAGFKRWVDLMGGVH
jgi:carboxymethylenebutenolidase